MSKKIEPTVAMILEAASTGTPLGTDARAILRAALNHPDAAGLFADEGTTRAAREQGWDDAAQHIYNKGWEGVTALRKANPYRPVQELPTKPGTVIVPADGHEYITATVFGETWRTREAILSYSGNWNAVWRSGGHARVAVRAGNITPGTCQVDDQ